MTRAIIERAKAIETIARAMRPNSFKRVDAGPPSLGKNSYAIMVDTRAYANAVAIIELARKDAAIAFDTLHPAQAAE